MDMYSSPVYKRARQAYIWQCTFEYLATILVSDVFLAKLLSSIGISDALIGVISSFIALAFLFQLFSLVFVQHITSIKRTVIFFSLMSQILFMCLYLVPFTMFNTQNKTILVIICVLFAYFSNYLVASILFKWANSFVDPQKRGEYSAGKEMVSLVTGMIFTIIIGYVIDSYEAFNNIEGGFLFTAIAIFILSTCNFICLILIKDIKSQKPEKVLFKKVLKNTLGNKNFANVIILTVLWDIARYMTIGFLGIYKTKDLLISVGTVQVINLVGNGFRFVLSKPFGRYSDKHSYAKGMELAFVIAAAAFLINMFATPSTWWCIIIYTVLFNVSTAGTNQNSFNITYSYVKDEYFVQAMAIKNSIGGLCGFGASLLGSKILAYVQYNGNMLFGISIYGQQLLSLISFIVIIACVLFIHFVISKQKVIVQ